MPEDLSFEVNKMQDSMPDISRLLSKKFTVSRKGYSVDEVREFIFDIELYFNKMLRREADLQLKLAEAIKRIESPELDEETLSKAIGIESGKVLKAAHEASKDILTQAKLKADEILNEALSALDNSTATAAVEADKIIEDARTKADSIIQEANNNCLDTITEAKSAKKRILQDLIERRSVLSRQIRQMQAALETFQTIFADTVTAVDGVNVSLLNAEETAKKAGEEASLKSKDDIEETFALEIALESNGIFAYEDLDVEQIPVESGPISDDDRASFDGFLTDHIMIDEITTQDSQTPSDSDFLMYGLDEKDNNSNDNDDSESPEDDDRYFQLSESGMALEGQDTENQDHVFYNGFRFADKVFDTLDEESGFRILEAPSTGQGSQSGKDKPDESEDQSIIVPNANFIKRSDIQDIHSQNISEAAAVFIQSKNSTDANHNVLSGSEGDSFADSMDQDDRAISLYSVIDAAEVSFADVTTPGEASIQYSGSEEDIISADNNYRLDDDSGGSIEVDTGSINEIDAIFAQIRAGRDKEVLKAVSILRNDLTSAISPSENKNSTDVKAAASTFIEGKDSVTHRDDVGDVLDYAGIDPIFDDTGMDKRQNSDPENKPSNLYEYLKEPHDALLKRVKRIIRQHQNVILDELRLNWHNTIDGREKLESTGLDDQDAETITLLLATIYATSYGFNGQSFADSKYIGLQDIQIDFSGEAKSLINQILEPVNMILEKEIYEGDDSKQSESDFMEHISLVYRDLRGERLDRIVGDFIVAASCRGIYDYAAEAGYDLKWVMDLSLESCPDCEDNSLSSATAVNELFPTGHLMPPAHPGCRCSIKAIVKDND